MSVRATKAGGMRGARAGRRHTVQGRESLHLVFPAWQAVQALRTEGALAGDGGGQHGGRRRRAGWRAAGRRGRTLAGCLGGGPGEALVLLEVGRELLVVLELLGVDRRRGRVLGRRGGL